MRAKRKKKRTYGAADLRSNRKHQNKRVALNRKARRMGIYGKRWSRGVDLSHTKSGNMVLEKRSKNRSRNGKNGKSTKK